jgi:hypothetical protein
MAAIINLDDQTYAARTRALAAWWCMGSSTLNPAQVFALEIV